MNPFKRISQEMNPTLTDIALIAYTKEAIKSRYESYKQPNIPLVVVSDIIMDDDYNVTANLGDLSFENHTILKNKLMLYFQDATIVSYALNQFKDADVKMVLLNINDNGKPKLIFLDDDYHIKIDES